MSEDPGAVLITGCSSGIGHETASRLAAKGWTVYATARRPERIADLADRGCRTLALDVTDEASMRDAVAAVEGEHGAVGALVNNAGLQPVRRAGDPADGADPRAVRDERLRARADVPAGAAGDARAGRGTIVNISSMGGKLTFPGGGAYRDQARGGGALGRPALGGPRLRGPRRGHRAGADHDPVRRDRRRLTVGGRGARDRRRPLRLLQRGRRLGDRQRLRGADGTARRRAGGGGEGDRAGDLEPTRGRVTRSPPRPGSPSRSGDCCPTGRGTRCCAASFQAPEGKNLVRRTDRTE